MRRPAEQRTTSAREGRARRRAPRSSALAPPHEAAPLFTALAQLRREISQEGAERFSRWRPLLQRRAFHPSAENLALYLALRHRDLRPLQAELMPWGLSSLGRAESRVGPSLDAVVATLARLAGVRGKEVPAHPTARTFYRGYEQLQLNAREVFGQDHRNRHGRIMVTLPSEAATDVGLVKSLIAHGLDCARINCAHDDPEKWAQMIGHLRSAAQELGRPCTVLMDLAGPKVRTVAVRAPEGTRLRPADHFLLTARAPDPSLPFLVQMQCSHAALVEHLDVGHKVYIDDGRLGCTVERLVPAGAVLRVTMAKPKGNKVAVEKSVNAPATPFHLAPLSERDLADLTFVVAHADLVGFSFVQEVEDVLTLQRELAARQPGRALMPVVLKIETARAVQHLPELIVAAGGKQQVAVMIARGDLAVEIGYERLAEIQEEILWVAEAASVPVIWATQVLDRFVKSGTPTRAEISDAAMGERAECVMLNKGPHVVEAVSILDDILGRMETHQAKKTPQLRALRLWQ